MTDHDVTRPQVRLTGGFYLLIAVAGGFSIAFVPSVLMVPGDPATSLQRIADQRWLFLAGIGGDAVMMLSELVVTVMLFRMFARTHSTVAGIAALARFAMVGVMAAMLLFHAGTLMLADAETATGAFHADQRAALGGVFLQMHDAGVWVWQLFFALHLVLLGWLTARSHVFPRLLGPALMVGSAGYLADSLHAVAFPDSDLLGMVKIGLLGIVTLAELGFALTLLVLAPIPGSGPEARNFRVAARTETV